MHAVSRPRPRPGSSGLETKTDTLDSRSRDRDRDLDKMNSSLETMVSRSQHWHTVAAARLQLVTCVCSILKVGVACMNDARYLLRDHGLQCVGCVDLRHLVPRTMPSANMYVHLPFASNIRPYISCQ